jgi:hypothetical protein
MPAIDADIEFARAIEILESAPRYRRAPEHTHQKNGSKYLDVYRWNDLAIVQDATGEWMSEATTHVFEGDLDWVLEGIHDAFLEHFDDEYQYLTILMVRDLQFFAAFYSPLSNDILGIGYDSVGRESFDLSESTVEGMIWMNYYGLWKNESLSRYTFGQEFQHRWGAFVNLPDDGMTDALLGRDTAHWSYWLDTPNSPMEGNAWIDNGDGTYTTDPGATSTFSDLDLYLAGLISPEEVAPSTLLLVSDEEAARVGKEPATTPEYFGARRDVTVTATPYTVTVEDIIAAEGPRVPGSDESPKVHNMAILVLVLDGDELTDKKLEDIDEIRLQWEAGWEEDVRGLADLDTSLGNSTAPTWGEPVDTGDTGIDDTGTPDSGDPSGGDTATGDADAEPAGTDATPEDAACGCASHGALGAGAGAGAWIGLGAVLAAAGSRRRSP